MRILLCIAMSVLLSSVAAIADQPLEQTFPEMQPWMLPASDETPVADAAGNDETDVMLDCYAGFRKRDPELGHLGPPSIRYSPRLGYILRADFTSADRTKVHKIVHRFVCLGNGSSMQEEIAAPPLYLPDVSSPDADTARAMAGWSARRNAEEERDQTRFPPPDSEIISRLEGIWLVGRPAGNGNCLTDPGTETQIEFEFRKTGGRVQIYEPFDLFSTILISGIKKSGDVFVLQAFRRTDGFLTFMRFRDARDHLEFLPVREPVDPSKRVAVKNAYRCGDANLTVNRSVSRERLAQFAPPVSGGWSLHGIVTGFSSQDMCQGKGPSPDQIERAPWLQLEFYGPVHYWIFGRTQKREFDFDHIRSIEEVDDHTLRLKMQRRGRDRAWESPEQGSRYDLTLIDRGAYIDIPELETSFAKCKPTDPLSVGVHRW